MKDFEILCKWTSTVSVFFLSELSIYKLTFSKKFVKRF